ncbi:MAG: DUF2799 domain-containing protein [Parvularculaceae bacterium]|nr:DUF2799 domain-containing protein [Parvularculaceae bacterium]
MLRSLLLSLGLIVAVSGCATLSKEECEFANWEAMGQNDGQWGETVGRFQRYSEACSNYGIQADFEAWERGRQTGLTRFCTPQGVYAAGMRRRGNMGECGFDPELNRIHRITTNFATVRSQLNSAENALDSLLSSYDWDRRNVRNMRKKLRRDDLGKKERKRAERSLRNSLEDLDRFPYRQREARSRLRRLERDFDRAQYELIRLEVELEMRARDRFDDRDRDRRFDPLIP